VLGTAALGRIPVSSSNTQAWPTYLAEMQCVGAFPLRRWGDEWLNVSPHPEEPIEFDAVLVEDAPPTPCVVRMTETGTARGAVKLEMARAAGGMVAEYRNLALWQPNVATWFKLVNFDRAATALKWAPYIQVLPRAVYNCRNVHGGAKVYGWTIGIPDTGQGGLEPYDEIDHSSEPPDELEDGDCGGCGFKGVIGDVRVDLCLAWTTSTTGNLLLQLGDLAGGAVFNAPIDGSPIEIEYEFVGGGTVTVTATPLLEGTPFGSIPCNTPGSCYGISTWIMRRRCHAGGYAQYKWELQSSDCSGRCETPVCRPKEPWPLLPGLVSDEDAEDLGYFAYVDAEPVNGACQCGPEPPAPDCVEGCSAWTMRRLLCTGAQVRYIYLWEPLPESCDGVCGSGNPCYPTPPFELPLGPLTDAEAEEWSGGNLLEMVDSDFAGGCSCSGDPYESPECPVVCEGVCDYNIVGYASDNGTFGIQTGDRTVAITHDGTPSGNEQGTVYLQLIANNCTDMEDCGCSNATLYSTKAAFWPGGEFPSDGSALGQGRVYDCEDLS